MGSLREEPNSEDKTPLLFAAIGDVSEDVAVDASDSLPDIAENRRGIRARNLVGFWILGLCNNYAYVIMLSAAHDILRETPPGTNNDSANFTGGSISLEERDCNKISTGAILLADVLPSLCIKVLSPFIVVQTIPRMIAVVALSLSSFITVAMSQAKWVAFLGVVCASLSGGLGEVTLLAYSARFDRNVVSTWSSGTGGSGILGAISYAALTSAGITPRTTLLLMVIVPFLMAVSFFCVLAHPSSRRASMLADVGEDLHIVEGSVRPCHTFKRKLLLIKPLLRFMVPLSLVYLAEYFINQGLLELIYFPGIWLSHQEQYRWFQVDYQLGVFISRSSVNLVTIDKLWLLPILQFMNVILFVIEAYFLFLPSIWIVFAMVFFEGLLGGGAYVNTFYKIAQEIPAPHREFSMGVASVGDSFGVAVAGAIALPVHDLLCRLPLPT